MEPSLQHLSIDQRLERLRRSRPAMHTKGDTVVDYGIDPYLMAFLRSNVSAGQRTIETGSGLSTVIFLLLGTEHTAVSPDPAEPARIRAYCAEHEISTERYHPIVGGSESALPALSSDTPFDMALVDGNHAFPAPLIDWFYLTRVLKKDGLLILDDLQLWPCRMLADFMDEEDAWRRLTRSERVGAYQLLADPQVVLSRNWTRQRYVTRRSKSWTRMRLERQLYRFARRIGLMPRV